MFFYKTNQLSSVLPTKS